MLTRISSLFDSEIPSICAYTKFLAEIVVERDIGAHKTCHMFLKIHVVISSCRFVIVNVGRKTFKIVSSNLDNNIFSMNSRFLELYQNILPFLEHLTLINTALS